MEKSVQRLAAKDGQPETVAVEYRKVGSEIADCVKSFTLQIHAMEAEIAAKLPKVK